MHVCLEIEQSLVPTAHSPIKCIFKPLYKVPVIRQNITFPLAAIEIVYSCCMLLLMLLAIVIMKRDLKHVCAKLEPPAFSYTIQ